ncbi:LacI family DNA-binding transcriptional regulator [Pelagibacterium xiamenense]|uniref:LacI family DNA-binding transcriptional regulator n=1 Tax=Pelagibacterium xiamenense TaxID=2901140 RepID=UPI001E2FE50D|nr:LacI family DNA-binding transcriptional regulator [Pelagibacterium xiamenense]MCD7059709.1 LacI family DNA-binding transcriptional regulator [Pelagibacterium xiamenense]
MSIPDHTTGQARRRKKQHSGVTMADVGRLAGVSQVTVSRALSDPSKVSAETLQKIRDAIDVTGFVPNAIAGALASQRSMLISAFVPSITNIVYSSFIQTFNARIRSSGYEVLLSETGFLPEEEEKLVAAHLTRRPDAVLLTGIHHSARTRKMLLGAGTPVVEVWDVTDSPIDVCVGFSHSGAGRAAADFIADQGYRSAAVVSAGDERAQRRMRAFSDRFAQRTGAAAIQLDFPAPASLANGRLGLRQLLETHAFSDGAIFCSSDLLAHGVIIEARARGLRVPEDVAVLGFGDQDFAPHTDPAISTIRVDRQELGRAAADALLERFAGRRPERDVFDIGFEIVRRASC